jgi:hypothetical protein
MQHTFVGVQRTCWTLAPKSQQPKEFRHSRLVVAELRVAPYIIPARAAAGSKA